MNTNNQTFDLTIFSKEKITFLTDQVNNKKLFTIGHYHFFKIPQLDLITLKDFLQILEYNKAFIILPILATEESKTTGGGPILSLSKQILVTRDSDPITIRNFLLRQIDIACMDYGISDLGNYTVVLKFRPIGLKEEIVLQIPKIQYDKEIPIRKKILNILKFRFFNGTILPLSMKLALYGNKLNKFLSSFYIQKFDLDPEGFFFKKDELVIYIKVTSEGHEGILFDHNKKEIIYKFEDIITEGNKFIRIMDKYIIYIDNFNITHLDRLMNNTFISASKANAKLNSQIVTFDIETYIKDGKFIPFSCGWFTGDFMKTYYLTDFKSHYEMLLQALTELLDFNPNAKVYIHNFSNFDYMFLIKVLFENFIVKPYFRDNKVINLVYQHKDNDKSKIYLFDSYLILPSSLRTLALKYKIADLKGYFPYSFVNENNLDYIGITPDISLFNGITPEEYEGLVSFTWNLRNELIRYLELDLKSLYQIITRFSQDIFSTEKIDVTKLPTISSIAFKIFRTNYLENSKLPIIKGNAHNEMRNAYYGGVVEVFKNEGENLNLYDVTSLYPFAMLNDMPTGNMLFSTDPNINNYFGIVFVEVDTTALDPKYINYPLLPHKIDGRMYNLLGKWYGWYFSEEIKLAMSVGYSVKVLYGYKFDKTAGIFNSFIESPKSGFFNLFSDIKSRRREYGTPNISNVGLPRPELSPLNIPSTSNLPDDNEGIDLEDSNLNKESHQVILPLHDWKEEVKLNVHKGSVGDRKIDFDLGENAKDIKSLHFITNDGISFAVNPNTTVNMAHTNTISWDIKGKSNPYWKDLDLYSVTLIDKAGKGTELYCNNKPKFLPCFKDNIGKRFT